MNSRYHPEDTDAVERLHARFMADNDLNDHLIEFQDKAYAMGRARGLQEALPTFDEAAERAVFEEWFTGNGFSSLKETAWFTWAACAKRKAGVQ